MKIKRKVDFYECDCCGKSQLEPLLSCERCLREMCQLCAYREEITRTRTRIEAHDFYLTIYPEQRDVLSTEQICKDCANKK